LAELYGLDVSPELVSAVTDAILEDVAEWPNRPLEPVYPLIFFDALRVKIGDEGTVRNKAVYLALGVRACGRKEILGLWIEQSEGAKFWLRVMAELKNRGVEDVLIAVAWGLKGFPEAITAVFPEAQVQTCIVHLIRNALSFVSYKDRKTVAAALKEIYRAAAADAASAALAAFAEALGRQIPGDRPHLAAALERGRSVLRLSRRHPPDRLHHECHRGLERQAAPCRPDPRPLSERRGGDEAPVPGLASHRARLEHGAQRVGHGPSSVRDPGRRPLPDRLSRHERVNPCRPHGNPDTHGRCGRCP
jgi:hypothetical protein